MDLARAFGALRSRNYRLFFGGQIVSMVGTWMTQTASMWLVYHLSSSAFLLGVVGFASQAPIFLLAPFAGVWADRVNRHRLLVATQILAMLQSLALAAFALTKTIGISHIVALSLIQGVINAFDMPVRQALVVDFVESREHLGNAIALNSSLFNLARLIGPAIGGYVIASVGVGMCYLIDGASYLAVLAALFAMRLPPKTAQPRTQHPIADLHELNVSDSRTPEIALLWCELVSSSRIDGSGIVKLTNDEWLERWRAYRSSHEQNFMAE